MMLFLYSSAGFRIEISILELKHNRNIKNSQSHSGRMCQKRHVFEMFEITFFHPFRGLDIVLGRRKYHHSIRHEILPWNSGLTFILAQFESSSILGPRQAIMAHSEV